MAYRFLPLALLLLALIPAVAAQSLPDIERAAADAGADAVTARALAQAATAALGEDQRLTVSGQTFGNYGTSVSLDGARALVGALGESTEGAASGAGAVYVLELISGTWTQTARLTASDAASLDNFGWSVSLDGERALIGAVSDAHGGGVGAGSAYVFDLSGGVWNETQKLIASDADDGDEFGASVSLDGTRALIGAWRADVGGASSGGAAYVFDLAGGTWSQTQKLTASDADDGDQFGGSVSLGGERVLIGAGFDTHSGLTEAGSAYVFDLSGGTWSQTQKLTASDADDGDQFGSSVSLGGNRVLVGADHDSHSGLTEAGSAYVFDLSGGTWSQTQKLTSGDAATSDRFGHSVSLDGSRALIGANLDDHSGSSGAGSAYVFDLSGGVWSETQKLTANDAGFGDTFGASVSLDGERAFIGAPGDEHSGLFLAGSAYVFDVSGALWSETQKTTAVSAEDSDSFGTSVAMDGNRAIVGAFLRNHSGLVSAGAAHIFEFVSGAWVQTAELIASDAQTSDGLG
ncbi:MAG: FG-GAP repeat protein, partial [Bacteroidota bacterium]